MTKNLATLAEIDMGHACRGAGCRVCQELYFRRSREKWNRFWERATRMADKSYQPDCNVLAAIMTEEKEEEKQCNQ